MTGETDYAAANEALARLGLWAQRHPLSCCVKTLVWPTWESVGMITNFAVTKRYVTPMAVDEGVRHWLRELADCASGEVMFMGAVGRALTPIQIQGFSPILDLPNISQLIALHHHAGQPLRFRPFAHFSTHYSIDLAQAPFLHGFRIDGRPAMPASMLIEHACAVAGWVGPEDFRSLVPVALTNILVSLDQLVLPDPAHAKVQLHSEAAGRWVGEDWQVEVRCSQVSTGTELLRLTVVFRDVETPRPDLPSVSGKRLQRLVPGTIPSTQRARWSSHLFPAARWQAPLPNSEPGDRDTVRMGEVAPAQGNDLWALAFPPELRLPIHHLENVLRLLWSAPGPAGESAVTRWRIHRIVLGEAPACGAQWLVQRRDGQFRVIDRGGDLVVELSGVALEGATVE